MTMTTRRRLKLASLLAAASAAFTAAVFAADAKDKTEKLDPKLETVPAVKDKAVAEKFTRFRSPAETIASIELPPGYRLELVASEPDIVSPVCMAFDANGAMYVAEMRTYMLDADGSKTFEKKSRVTRLESAKNDGKYDKITVFADNLLLPRQLLPLDDRIIVRETNTKDLYAYRDTNGDGVADERTEFYKGGSVGGNLEHQAAHLEWNIDNWMYQTVDQTRFRYTTGTLETDKIPYRTGQWGYATDDTGRMIFATAGTEKPAHDFQVPMPYGQVSLSGELAKDFTEVYGLVPLSDYQGGTGRVKTGGGLNRFTGCAGPSVYRGDALPQDLYGDYILPEPVGRLIRRAKITQENGKTVLTNAYDKKEFMASTDANFRPVFSATGPDGCLYILDMYHGIIQESNWTKKGSYLRKEIERFGLDKNIGAGRIYRLVYDGIKPKFDRRPRMLSESPADLVKHLADANGWWRDTAQKLIVLRRDKSVVPALQSMAREHANPLARLHALWTLDGLGAIDAGLLVEKYKDADARVRAAAVRISEPLIKANNVSVVNALKATAATDADAHVVKQFCLSMLHAGHPLADALIATVPAMKEKSSPVATVVAKYKENVQTARAEKEKPGHLDKKYAGTFVKGKDLYGQTCIACHGPDGKGTPAPEDDGTTLAPPLNGSKRLLGHKDVPIAIAIHGMVGPHEGGKKYVNEMAGFPWADDNTLAAILTYARNDWGNKAAPVEPKDVAEARKSHAKRTAPFTFPEVTELMEKLTPTGGPTRELSGEKKK